MKDNAFDLYPKLKEEFDRDRNPKIDFITAGSNIKYWLNCSKCGEQYFNSVKNWVRVFNTKDRKFDNCKHMKFLPRQSKLKTNVFEHSPRLEKEWDFTLNVVDPFKTNYGSEERVYWNCSKCFSQFKAKINKRTSDGSDCPFCDGKKTNNTNSLGTLYPDVAKRLRDSQVANEITPFSSKKVEVKCNDCLEYFTASICSIVNAHIDGSCGCPYCSGKQVNSKNNLTITHPELCKEWDYDKNATRPEQYTAGCGSRNKVWWKCNKNHSWEASINSRTGSPSKIGGNRCPNCCHKISIPELQWLNSLNIKLEKQKKLLFGDKWIRVDGFDPITNTVYEFYGDYYHGNPIIYDMKDENYTCHKSFGELYQKTMDKEILIKTKYNLIAIWENDFNSIKKLV